MNLTFYQPIVIKAILFFCLFTSVYGQSIQENSPVSAEIIFDVHSFQPKKPFFAAVVLRHKEGWHTYSKNPGEMGLPTNIQWQLPEGFLVGEVKWPSPITFDVEGIKGFGYEGTTLLLAEITPPKDLSANSFTIKADVDWLACSKDTCLPGSKKLESILKVREEGPLYSEHREKIESAKSLITDSLEKSIESKEDTKPSLMVFLAMAFLGGMILNLMPCVLPVVSLKILNFVQIAGKNRSLIFIHGMAYAVGVLLSFWSLASVLLILQAYGSAVGWGFQLQEPLFVALLCVVLLVFSLSMFGVFEVGTIIQAFAGKKEAKTKHGVLSSFFSGILATAVATPCTGPFLGSAVGFAVTQSPLIALLMFTSLGMGMAFPYIILSAFPQFLRFLPKPGQWMVTFKEIVAFIMLATVLWLLWVFGAETDTYALFLLLLSLFFLSISCWIWGKFGAIHRSKKSRWMASLMVLFIIACSGKLVIHASMDRDSQEDSLLAFNTESLGTNKEDWVPFSKDFLDRLIKEGKPVFIDFTARWCLICQTNHMALSTNQVDKKFNELGVVKMKADWTRRDPSITEELKKFGRSGVPLYLYYDGKGKNPEVLPQILTPETVVDYLQEPK